MKIFILLSSLFLSTTLFAQDTIKTVDNKTIYVYNNQKDTIELSNISLEHRGFAPQTTTNSIIKHIQIDGKGSKEIVVYRFMKGSISDHGGTFDIDESKTLSKYEIWNVDTKELLFSAINILNHNYNRYLAYVNPTHQSGNEMYSYNFSINNAGDITISAFESFTKSKPDNKEGIYMFVEGKYILVE